MRLMLPLSLAMLSLTLAAVALAEPPDGKKGAEPTTSTTVAIASEVAPLFDLDREWTFTVTASSGYWDDQDPAADDGGMVRSSSTTELTCRVATVVDHGVRGRLSRIDCEDADVAPLSGVWAATSTGLYLLGTLPADADALADALASAELFLAAEPAAIEQKTERPDDEGMGSSYIVTAEDGAWCVERSWWGGDEAGDSLCLADDGPRAGGKWWAGGGEQETRFERVSTAAAKPPRQPFAVDAYAAWLFDADAEWTFEVEHLNAYWDDQDPRANADGMVESRSKQSVTCRVAEVRDFAPVGTASRITCDGDADLAPLTGGVWLATMDGLSRREILDNLQLPADVDELERHVRDGDRFLAATPVADTESHTNGDGHTRTLSVLAVTDGWCVEDVFEGGDTSVAKLCLTPSGPVSGQHGWSGGSINETSYHLVAD